MHRELKAAQAVDYLFESGLAPASRIVRLIQRVPYALEFGLVCAVVFTRRRVGRWISYERRIEGNQVYPRCLLSHVSPRLRPSAVFSPGHRQPSGLEALEHAT